LSDYDEMMASLADLRETAEMYVSSHEFDDLNGPVAEEDLREQENVSKALWDRFYSTLVLNEVSFEDHQTWLFEKIRNGQWPELDSHDWDGDDGGIPF
jgi:hypothetical protein